MSGNDYLNDREMQQELVTDFRKAVRQIAVAHQSLTYSGWDYPWRGASALQAERTRMDNDYFLLQVATAYVFICVRDLKQRQHSYTLKHRAESFGSQHGLENYVSNGAFIVAAIMQNYQFKQTKNSANCKFRPPDSPNPRPPYSLAKMVVVSAILTQLRPGEL